VGAAALFGAQVDMAFGGKKGFQVTAIQGVVGIDAKLKLTQPTATLSTTPNWNFLLRGGSTFDCSKPQPYNSVCSR